jgi:hypothetical protein
VGDIRRRWLVASIAAVVLSPLGALGVAADGLAADDSYSVAEDTVLTVPMEAGVLANDTGGSLVLCVSGFDTTSLQGTLQAPGVNPDGSFTYTPPANFHGTETVTYDVATLVAGACPPPPTSEGRGMVTITVDSVNDPPTAVADFFSALTDRTLHIAAPGVLANDSDVDGDTLTAVKASGAAHGSVKLASNGGFEYTPNPGFAGSDAFAYRASDGTDQSLVRVVNLTVTAIPPTRAPTPSPTLIPVPPSASPAPSPTGSPEPSVTGLATPSPGPSVAPSASASPGPVTGPTVGEGGPPIVAIAALALLLALLAVAGVFFVRSQRAGGEGDAQPGYLDGGDDEGGSDRA